jgi:hypothetical protein
LDDYSWDDHFLIGGEHSDFFLTHKKLGKWKFAVTPNFVVRHDPGGNERFIENRKSRKRKHDSMNYFIEKHNMKGFRQEGMHLPKKRNLREKVFYLISKKILPIQIWWFIHNNDILYNFRRFFNIPAVDY